MRGKWFVAVKRSLTLAVERFAVERCAV